jgi:hypothetical protein
LGNLDYLLLERFPDIIPFVEGKRLPESAKEYIAGK